MERLPDMLKGNRLVIVARGILTEILAEAADALLEAGVSLLESIFDHTQSDPIRGRSLRWSRPTAISCWWARARS